MHDYSYCGNPVLCSYSELECVCNASLINTQGVERESVEVRYDVDAALLAREIVCHLVVALVCSCVNM